MKNLLLGLFVTVTALFAGVHTNVHWGYDGGEDPAHWADLDRSYELCKKGQHQSPIDLKGVMLKPHGHALEVHYESDFELDEVNNGHTIQVNDQSGKNSIVFDGVTYKLIQFHFHGKSEHTINGEHAAMVAHLVHQSDDGALAVVGVLFDIGEENNVLKAAWKLMPKKAGKHIHNLSHIHVEDLLPEASDYFTYEGSLTTPPCTEGVRWIILKKRATVSKEQLERYRSLYDHNYRPVNPLNDRKVEEVY